LIFNLDTHSKYKNKATSRFGFAPQKIKVSFANSRREMLSTPTFLDPQKDLKENPHLQ
jgi:hypothetical protein